MLRTFRHFFLDAVVLGLAVAFILAPSGLGWFSQALMHALNGPSSIRLEACKTDFSMPAGLTLRSKHAGLTSRVTIYSIDKNIRGKVHRFKFIFSCLPNHRKTSNLQKMEESARIPGGRILHLRRFPLKDGTAAAIFQKRRSNSPDRTTLHAYFAHRNWVYRIAMISAKQNNDRMAELTMDAIARDLEFILQNVKIQRKYRPAIDETQYRKRLYIFIFSGIAIFLGGGLIIFILKRRRKS